MKCKLINKKELIKNVFLLRFNRPENFIFEPGQFIVIQVSGKNRLYSIASSPLEKDFFELIVELIPNGLGSSYLTKLQINDEIEINSINGIFKLRNSNNPKVFFSTGVGVTPLRSMVNYLIKSNFKQNIYFYWGTRYDKDIILQEDWQKISENNNNFNYKICLSREKILKENIEKGYVQEIFEKDYLKVPKKFFNAEYYLCGGIDIVKSIKEFLIEKIKVKKENIFEERYT